MKNKGIFQVLKKGDKYKIVYIEKGEIFVVYSYEFDRYEEAMDYKKNNKEELDKVVTEKKEAEQKRREKEEEERKAKEAAEKAKKEEKEKKKQERKEKTKAFFGNGWVKFTSGFLVAVMLLTGGHFAGKGIANAIRNKDSKKPSTSQTDPTQTTDPTNSTEPTIDINEDFDNIINYAEMYNTENFEKMVADFAKPYVSNGVSLTTEDLLKFATIVNIDRLAEENPEFAKELFSAQTAEEYLNDAAKTIGMTYMYNHTMWEKDKNTDNFIWISSSIPEGDPQKDKMVELEGYVTKIAKVAAEIIELEKKIYIDKELVEEKKEEVNKLTYELIESLTLPDGSLNALDDGVEFGAQVYFALINNSIARNYLNQEYRDYFDTRSSSEQNVSNIFTVYNRCITDSKVRTKGN